MTQNQVSLRAQAEQAKALLLKPFGWTQHAFARDAQGARVSAYDPTACSFCILGAAAKVSCSLMVVVDAYIQETYGASTEKYNDTLCMSAEQAAEVFDHIGVPEHYVTD